MEAVKTMIRHSKTETSEVPRTLTDISMLVADVLLEAGYLLGCAGQYPESEKCFKAILALDSRCIGGWLGLGNVLLIQGRTDESEAAYEMVLQEEPGDPAARAFLGELYLCTGRIPEGREMLESVYWDYPESKTGTWAWKLVQLSRMVHA